MYRRKVGSRECGSDMILSLMTFVLILPVSQSNQTGTWKGLNVAVKTNLFMWHANAPGALLEAMDCFLRVLQTNVWGTQS
eukprot:1128102-Pelagomonas_calceolata.AAC.2